MNAMKLKSLAHADEAAALAEWYGPHWAQRLIDETQTAVEDDLPHPLFEPTFGELKEVKRSAKLAASHLLHRVEAEEHAALLLDRAKVEAAIFGRPIAIFDRDDGGWLLCHRETRDRVVVHPEDYRHVSGWVSEMCR
jgi:hypothetical protein